MSYIGLADTPDGIDVDFYDTPEPDGDFVEYDLTKTRLSRDQVHTIKFWIQLNPGTTEDLVRISIDGQDSGQCFTTWKYFYQSVGGSVPITDSLLFLSGNRDGNRLSLLGGGYLFDDVTTTASASGGPPGCDLLIDKTADSPTVTAGGLAGYHITVDNRGRLAARNLALCDLIPRETSFVSANRKLRQFGRRRCLMIGRLGPGQRTGFHIDLRVATDASPGNLPNIADLTPSEPPGLLGSAGVPLPDVPAKWRPRSPRPRPSRR